MQSVAPWRKAITYFVVASLALYAGPSLTGCTLAGSGPVDVGDFGVTGMADATLLTTGSPAQLMASATGGTPPFVFRWDLNDGPAEVTLDTPVTELLITPALTVAGRYVFRVTGTDHAGRTTTDFVTVEVVPALLVTASTDSPDVFAGASVTVSADVTDVLNPPVSFGWELVSGPIALDLSSAMDAAIEVGPLVEDGDYLFEVTVTDQRGFVKMADVSITVRPALSVAGPELAVVGEAVQLDATIETDAVGVTVMWEVVSGSATLDDVASLSPMVTAVAAGIVELRATASLPQDGADPVSVSSMFTIVAVADTSPQVLVETNFGSFTMELNASLAPGHAANFLRYVEDKFYEDLLFHRNACSGNQQSVDCAPFVLQGGGFERVDGALTPRPPTRPTISSEANPGLSSSVIHSVALALTGGDPDSGATQFFINLADNGFLDGQGFTAFAVVVQGTDVVNAIVAMPRTDSTIIGGEVSLPVEDVIMQRLVWIVE